MAYSISLSPGGFFREVTWLWGHPFPTSSATLPGLLLCSLRGLPWEERKEEGAAFPAELSPPPPSAWQEAYVEYLKSITYISQALLDEAATAARGTPLLSPAFEGAMSGATHLA